MTAEGVIVITARRFRTQRRNRADAYERLIDLLRRAVRPGKPRLPTRPTLVSRMRHREAKAARSRLKLLRQAVDRQAD